MQAIFITYCLGTLDAAIEERTSDRTTRSAGTPHRWVYAGYRPAPFRAFRLHGNRAARLLEPQHAHWLQGRFRAIRERKPPRDILTGFLAPAEWVCYGRPVGVALGPDGFVLVADDVGDVIWR
jgi:glucose/arabinose dehydrogenase